MPDDPFEVAQVDSAIGTIVQSVFLIVVGCLAMPYCRQLWPNIKRFWLLFLVPTWAVTSALWSQDPAITIRKALMLLAPTLLALTIHLRLGITLRLKVLFFAAAAAAVASIALCLLAPNYGLDQVFHAGAWQGIYAQKNVCARACVFLSLAPLAWFGQSYRKTASASLVLGALGLLLFKTQSRTGMLFEILLIAMMVIFALFRRLGRGELFVLLLAVCAGAASTAVAVANNFQEILWILGKSATLTGRTDIWQGAIEAIIKHPLIGYGYNAFWLGFRGESANIVLAAKWLVPTAHNGFLDILLQLGMIGLILFLISFAKACLDAFWCLRHVGGEAAYWCAGVLFLTIIYNFDESSLLIPTELLWVLYVLAFLSLHAMRRAPQCLSAI
jgi:O-antigen ligase